MGKENVDVVPGKTERSKTAYQDVVAFLLVKTQIDDKRACALQNHIGIESSQGVVG